MNKVLITLVMLAFMANTHAEDILFIGDIEISQEQLGSIITIPVKAHFDHYVSAWDLHFTQLPAGLTLTRITKGSDMSIPYIDEYGDDQTCNASLSVSLENLRCVGMSTIYTYAYDEDGNLMGVVHWPPGDYDEMLKLTFQVDYDFCGDELIMEFVPTASGWGDHSNDCPKNSYYVLSSQIIVPPPLVLVDAIEMNQTEVEINEGDSFQLEATVYPDNAFDKTVSWSSGNTAVAAVDDNGLVTAVAPGEATITATANDGSNCSASCAVTVLERIVVANTITLNKTSADVAVGKSVQLQATVGPVTTINKTVTWSSGNPTVAVVDNTGLVTAVAPGEAVITATTTDGSNLTASCDVSVYPVIIFDDANVKAICVSKWDTDGDGELSMAEAAAVTSLNNEFKNNQTITSFNELQHFTGLTTISSSAFYGCTRLSSITIPNSVTTIGSSAFHGCSGLIDVIIGTGITEIRGDEFSWNGQMRLKLLSENPPMLKQFITIESLEVPFHHTLDYLNATNWHDIPLIFAFDNGNRYYPVPYYATGERIVTVNGESQGVEAEEGSTISIRLSSSYHENPIYESVKYRDEEILGFLKANQVYQFTCDPKHELNAIYSETESQDNTFIIHVTESGTLIDLIGTENVLKVKYLKVSGNLNGTDILAIRKMTNLLVLDMDEAHIVDGGASYYQSYTTSKDAIGEYFFKDITNLSRVILPKDIKTIKSNAFSDMTNLAEITIPDSVTTIGYSAFSGCTGLTTMHWNAINCSSSIGRTSNLTLITIGESVQVLPLAFAEDAKITTITIPNSVTNIGEYAFLRCKGLTELTIPINVKTINYNAFGGCTGLTTLHWNAINCSSNGSMTTDYLTLITIGEAVKVLPSSFAKNSKITSITIPGSVTTIGSSAFYGCTMLTDVTIPNSVTTINSSAFQNCSRLASVIIQNSVKSIGSSTFQNCSGLASVSIPGSVTSIGSSAFSGCTGLTSIDIPDGITVINASVFYRCSGLTSVTIPNSVTSIGNSAFCSCTGLETVSIGYGVTSIAASAFAGCTGLSEIFSCNLTPPVIEESTFDAATEQTATLHVPAGCRTIYWLHPYWENFANIVEMDPVHATRIELTPASASLIIGETLQMSATVLPINTTNKAVTWNTSNPSIATVDSTGLVTAYALGTTVIMATTTDGSNLSANCTVTVVPVITFADANVKAICVSRWDINGDGELSETEAAAVTALNNAFKNNQTITSFNELQYFTGLTALNASEFYNCKNLTSITIPNSVTTIGNSALYYCSSLSGITIPNSVASIGNYAFYYCSSLPGIFIPNSVTSIGNNAFMGCTSMTSATIPATITTLDNSAFSGCSGLTDVYSYIEDPTAVSMGSNVFYLYNARYANRTLHVPYGSISAYRTHQGWYPYFGNIVEMDVQLVLATGIELNQTAVEIAAGESLLLAVALSPDNATDKRVTWSSSNPLVASIDTTGLVKAVAVGSVTITATTVDGSNLSDSCVVTVTPSPDITFTDANVKAICVQNWDTNGDGELSKAEAAAVTTLNGVFKNNRTIVSFDELQYFTGLTAIEQDAFWQCTKLSSVTIPNSVTIIADRAFEHCYNLTGIIIPSSVETISCFSFDDCSVLSSITVANGNTKYDSRDNCNAIIETETNTLIVGCNGTVIPNSVKTIGRYAFYGSGLTSIDIPNSVTSIGQAAFYCCDSLRSVTIPNSVTYIASDAFNQSGLTSINIPRSVTYIGSSAFQSCSGLTSITVASGNTKYDSRNNCNAIIMTANNTLITGCMNTIIPNSVTTIGDCAFYYCTGLTNMTIPNSVTTIGDYAFYYCSGLSSVNIPNSVTTIGEEAFAFCSGLTGVIIPNSVTSIGKYAFYGCVGLTNIAVESGNTKYDSRDNCNAIIETASNTLIAGSLNTIIPNTVTAIGEAAFYGFKALTHVTIPNSVTYIGEDAFSHCRGMTDITIPNSVTSIGKFSFSHCRGLTSITLPNSVTSIGSYAFHYCSGLTSVTIPNSVTYIGEFAFSACSALTDVYSFISSLSEVSMGSSVFYSSTNNYSGRTLHVPTGTVGAYQADANWYPYFEQIVEMIPVTSISIDKTAAKMFEGETMQLTATVLPEDADYKAVTWASSNLDVATVDNNGLVTAITLGTATITATAVDDSNLSDSCSVTVTEDLSNSDNYLMMEDTTAFRGKTIVVPVKMVNEASIISFQTDIFLTEGLELVQEDGEYIIDPSSRMTRTHSLMSNDVSNGAVRVMCYSSNYKAFTGQSGDDLFYITVKIADDAASDCTIELRNTLLTTSDFEEIAAPDVAADVLVKAYPLGDANGSGTVTVTDVVVTSQHVMELNPQTFVFEAADVNFDGNITVTDVSRIAWMVLNPTLHAPRHAPAQLCNGDRMSGSDITLTAGETRRVDILLSNELDYAAFQLDLNLPEGLTASNFQLTARAGSHAFDVNTLQNGNIRALCYSQALDAISGNEGALLSFDVTGTGCVVGNITVDGIELVTTDCQTVKPDGFTIGVHTATATGELTAGKTISKVEYFNLAGQPLSAPADGVTLVVTTYTDGTRTTTKVFR